MSPSKCGSDNADLLLFRLNPVEGPRNFQTKNQDLIQCILSSCCSPTFQVEPSRRPRDFQTKNQDLCCSLRYSRRRVGVFAATSQGSSSLSEMILLYTFRSEQRSQVDKDGGGGGGGYPPSGQNQHPPQEPPPLAWKAHPPSFWSRGNFFHNDTVKSPWRLDFGLLLHHLWKFLPAASLQFTFLIATHNKNRYQYYGIVPIN